jgi:hypothetical protein
MSNSSIRHPSSYRDPSGFIFEKDGVLYRQVNTIFREDYELFIHSGCYEKLVSKGLLIPHETIHENWTGSDEWYLTLKPEQLAFISYPYEWSFDMLKDAALLTLQLVKEATAAGLILKDATPYNIQWHQGKLLFIDTLSFEKYNEEEPWIAYRQFCECFLSPLLLMHYSKISLQRLSLAYPEGIPLAVTKSFLPRRSKFSLHTYLHIHLHEGVAGKKRVEEKRKIKFSKQKLLNLVNSLETLILRLKSPEQTTTWSDYYEEASQRNDYLEQKKKIIEGWLDKAVDIRTGADLGANDGVFSRLLSARGIPTVAADLDPLCINNLYREIRKTGEKYIQPLIIDLSDPSPAIGVNNEERNSFISRLHVDMILALALIHHLAIGKNIPLALIAKLFAGMTRHLIIEFVPKDDPKVQEMLQQKKDIYTDYRQERFEEEMSKYFLIEEKQGVPGTGRVLFNMRRIV